MTRNSDFGASMSEFLEYTVDSEGDRPTVVKDSSTTRLTAWDGSIDQVSKVLSRKMNPKRHSQPVSVIRTKYEKMNHLELKCNESA